MSDDVETRYTATQQLPKVSLEKLADEQAEQPKAEFGTGLRVLIIDDEPSVTDVLGLVFEHAGFDVVTAATGAEAEQHLADRVFDVALVDKNLPDAEGLELLGKIRSSGDCAALMMTAYPNVDTAVEAFRLGACDYLAKPFPDLHLVEQAVRRAVKTQALERRNRQLVAELRASNETLSALAIRDPLTKLYNYAYMQEQVEREIARSTRNEFDFAFVFVDIDGFQAVNNDCGHIAGDQLLKQMAAVLTGSGNEVEGEVFRLRGQDLVARHGGDVYALLLPETVKAGATAKAEQLRAFIELYTFDGPVEKLTVSVGVAGFPMDGKTKSTLLEAADLALYSSKKTGRNRMTAYSKRLVGLRDQQSELAAVEAKVLAALEHSIATRDFDFVYQPIISVLDESTFAYEALCRPRSDVFPGPWQLIQAAENAGMVSGLGRALRESSVGALSELPKSARLFMNIHPQELYDPEFINVESFLAQWTDQVVFEITEVAGIKEYGRVCDIVARLRSHGFMIALDDLGAGYSGLTSLALLQPDFVKLDMKLVHSVNESARTRRLVKHILEFATDEGMQCIAEGVETKEQLDTFVEMGCPLVQGWYFSKGKPLAQIKAELAEQPPVDDTQRVQ
jgi:diguanylate cyclase (GGDEF)-like protein